MIGVLALFLDSTGLGSKLSGGLVEDRIGSDHIIHHGGLGDFLQQTKRRSAKKSLRPQKGKAEFGLDPTHFGPELSLAGEIPAVIVSAGVWFDQIDKCECVVRRL